MNHRTSGEASIGGPPSFFLLIFFLLLPHRSLWELSSYSPLSSEGVSKINHKRAIEPVVELGLEVGRRPSFFLFLLSFVLLPHRNL
jgi:hypothetical protein